MEDEISRWSTLASQIDEKLKEIDLSDFSEEYILFLSRLLSKLRLEISRVYGLGPIEKQECYFEINYLGQKIRETAYFMSPD